MKEIRFNALAIYFFILILILLIFSLGYGYGFQINNNHLDNSDYIFLCNPHYFGAEWSFPNECPNSYINATGNYCNGIIKCENKLRDGSLK